MFLNAYIPEIKEFNTSVFISALNDSKYIGFCIYNVVIVCIFGVPLTHVLPIEQTTLNFVLLSALVMFCTTMCLCILFIPKVIVSSLTLKYANQYCIN